MWIWGDGGVEITKTSSAMSELMETVLPRFLAILLDFLEFFGAGGSAGSNKKSGRYMMARYQCKLRRRKNVKDGTDSSLD